MEHETETTLADAHADALAILRGTRRIGSVVPPSPPQPGATVPMDKLSRDIVAASLAGGMIAASGTPHTVEQALVVFRAVRDALRSTS